MSAELITNGDFEAGVFSEWIVNNIFGSDIPGIEMWLINDGNVEIPFPEETFNASDPISGSFDAISDYTALSQIGLTAPVAALQQNVTLPLNITSATLSWKDRIYSSVDFDFEDSVMQAFSVLIRTDSSNPPILRWYYEGDPIQPGPNPRSITEVEVDGEILSLTELLQPLAGQEVEIIFAIMAQNGPLFVTVDDVGLNVNTLDDMGIDIKPGSDPNCFNNDGHGVIPVAILGSAGFDVTTIDAGSVMLEGLAIKAVGKSNKLLAHYDDVNNDGYYDLVVQIEDTDQVFAEGDTTATVTGYLNDETYFQGSDTICIVP